jgi:hypothetical protein
MCVRVFSCIIFIPSPLALMHFQAGNTPLHVAADARSKQLVPLLLQNGADVNARGEVWVCLCLCACVCVLVCVLA